MSSDSQTVLKLARSCRSAIPRHEANKPNIYAGNVPFAIHIWKQPKSKERWAWSNLPIN